MEMKFWDKVCVLVIMILIGIWLSYGLIMSVYWEPTEFSHEVGAGYEWFYPSFATIWIVIIAIVIRVSELREPRDD